MEKSNQAEYAQYGSDSWRDTRALIRARFSDDSAVKHRYASRSPYDYSDKGGGLDNVMLNNGDNGRATQQDTRVPLNLRDASSNPLMLFLQTMMPWNRVEIPENAAVSSTETSTRTTASNTNNNTTMTTTATNNDSNNSSSEVHEEKEEEIDSDEMDDDI